MSADPKSPLDHVNDTVLQLKEMRHYSKNNVELNRPGISGGSNS